MKSAFAIVFLAKLLCDFALGEFICPYSCTSQVSNLTAVDIEGIWFNQIGLPSYLTSQNKCSTLNVTKIDAETVQVTSTEKNKL